MRIASSPRLVPVIATTGFCAVLSFGAYAAQQTRSTPSLEVPAIAATADEPVRLTASTTAMQPSPPPAPSKELLFVFRAAGDTYVELSSDVPRHGPRKLFEGDDGTVTVAEVEASNLPAKFRSWPGERLIVDGECTAQVTGFAVVTRLVGTPVYAGFEDDQWTVATAAKAGNSVLAARLDDSVSCPKGMFARRASLAPIVIPDQIENPQLADAARASLLASQAAQDAQTAWAASDPWYDHATFTTRVLVHPTTDVTWVAIHAGGETECGGANFNVFGLYRVAKDGTLIPVVTRKLETIYSIERIIDLDDDGSFELVGHDWLGLSIVLGTADGEEIDRLEMPFHGCPC